MEPQMALAPINYTFATDCYTMDLKLALHACGKRLTLANPSYESLFESKVHRHLQSPSTVFHLNSEMEEDNQADKLSDTHYFWYQAPIDPAIHDFRNITVYSGKILVFVNSEKLKSVWQGFYDQHEKGALGYALRCSTNRPNPNANSFDKLITVHIVNCFDLDNVAKVAFRINQIMGEWEGNLRVMTDLATEIKYLDGNNSLSQMTFSIKSRFFKYPNGEAKAIEVFTSLFVKNNSASRDQKKAEIDKYLSKQK